MSHFVSIYRVYLQHLQNIIADLSKKCDHVTAKGKYNKLIDTSVLVWLPFLIDILEPWQSLSLITQKNNLSIADVADGVEKIFVAIKKAQWKGKLYINCFSSI